MPGKNIFDLDKIFIPVNLFKNHWACAVIFMQEKRIRFHDSMRGDGYHYSEGLLKYLEDEWISKNPGMGILPDSQKWEIVGYVDGVPQQPNGFDCGLFTCMFANFLSINRPLSFTQIGLVEGRNHIALSIMNDTIV